ncbi:MAG: 3-deoxy-8-phosphooctulonate synthase, partial [Lentisphaeria bacterium]|nr:3-deoxy-8-phosphooctulonate synthase [Lentisphaeria bacterium]
MTVIAKLTDSISVGDNQPPLLISGPCVIEEYELCLEIGRHLKAVAEKLGYSYIFKASFDKANRTSIQSYR